MMPRSETSKIARRHLGVVLGFVTAGCIVGVAGILGCGAASAEEPPTGQQSAGGEVVLSPAEEAEMQDGDILAGEAPEVSEERTWNAAALLAQAGVDVPPSRLGRLNEGQCREALSALGVATEDVAQSGSAAAVEQPVIIEAMGDVPLVFHGRRGVHRIIDCRLALALTVWAPRLKAAGVDNIRHLSAFRPGARHRRTGRPSGHAKALAIDLRYFDLGGEEPYDILDDWRSRERGAEPCGAELRSEGDPIRLALCDAVDAGLFQVVVTPHHDDAHANHLHVEVVPTAGWQWVR